MIIAAQPAQPRRRGALVVEGLAAGEALAIAGDLLPPPRPLGCARPLATVPLPASSGSPGLTVRIARLYHGSVVDGPGRCSTAKFRGCAIRCDQCITPDSWDPTGGCLVPVDRLADALLDPAYERDGVSILGGEPFQQPDGLLALVRVLRTHGCRHVLVYSGYTYERLRRMAEREPAIGAVVDEIDMLIDGPYVAALSDGAGPWTGSGNQRVLDLHASRGMGRASLRTVDRSAEWRSGASAAA